MQYRSMEQIASEADVFTIPSLSRRDRLERWAEALARQPAQLCAIPDVEYGPRRERDASASSTSPRIRSTLSRYRRPASVSVSLRVVRRRSRTPNRSSMAAMCLVAMVCDMPSTRAAAEKLPSAATREKTCIPVTRSSVDLTPEV